MSGFSIKSSHKFINPKQQESTTTVDPADFEGDYTAYDLSDNSVVKASISKNTSTSTAGTNTDTNVKTGSAKGMAIRTTVKSMEDWY